MSQNQSSLKSDRTRISDKYTIKNLNQLPESNQSKYQTISIPKRDSGEVLLLENELADLDDLTPKDERNQ